MEDLFAQIDELRDVKQLNQKLKHQDINRKFYDSKIERKIMQLNKLFSDNNKVIMQSLNKLECQDSELYQFQQIKDLQQQNNDLKNAHK